MAREETLAAVDEEYLYLYDYTIEGISYNYWDYFKNRQEAETTILFWNAGAPYIKTVSLQECKNGVIWRGLHIPYKKSAWTQMLERESGLQQRNQQISHQPETTN